MSKIPINSPFFKKEKGRVCFDCACLVYDEKLLPEKEGKPAGMCSLALPMFAKQDHEKRVLSIHTKADNCDAFVHRPKILRTMHALSEEEKNQPVKIGPFYIMVPAEGKICLGVKEFDDEGLFCRLEMTMDEARELIELLSAQIIMFENGLL